MSTTEDQESESPWGCLLLVAILFGGYLLFHLALAIHEATWPIWLLFSLGSLGWYLAAKRPGPWSKVHVSVLIPVTVGLGLLFVLMLSLNLGRIFVSAVELRRWEDRLISARLSLADWVKPTLPVFLCGLVALLLLSFLVPRLRIVSFALSGQRVVSSLYIVLITLTSFTFFAQVPLQEMVEDEYARNKAELEEGISQYELLLRTEQENLATDLATRTVKLALSHLDEDERQAYREMFEVLLATSEEEVSKTEFPDDSSFQSTTNYEPWQDETLRKLAEYNRRKRAEARRSSNSTRLSAIRQKVAAQLGGSHAAVALSEERFSVPPGSDAPAKERPESIQGSGQLVEPPQSPRERQEQLGTLAKQRELVDRQRQRTENAAKMAQETRAGLEALFCEIVGLGVPKFGGIVGPYIDAVVDQLSEGLFQKLVERRYALNSLKIELRSFSERMFLDIAKHIPLSGLLKPFDSSEMMPERLRLSIKEVTENLVKTEIQEAVRVEEARVESERRAQEQVRLEAERARARSRTQARARGR